MKKQVTFAETKFPRETHRMQQASCQGSQYSNRALINVNVGNVLRRTQEAPAAGQTPKKWNMKTIQIPKIMASAPFLENSELTPGQRRYLYTIVDAYSTEHVRKLIQQHYMNVLHRCIRTGQGPMRESPVVNLEVESMDYGNDEDGLWKLSPPKALNRSKKRGHNTVPPERTILPKIPNQYMRTSSDALRSKQKSKKRTRVVTWKKARPRKSKLWEDDDLDFDLEMDDDSLSESMSSLSMEGGGGPPMTTPTPLPDL